MTLRHPLASALRGLVLLTAITVALPASALSDGEREVLARLRGEIKALQPMIRDAQRRADHGGRRRFNYAWLRQDLARVRLGIDEYLTPGRSEPRTPTPIKGEYVH